MSYVDHASIVAMYSAMQTANEQAKQLRDDHDELLATLKVFLPYWRMQLENEGPGQVPLLLEEVERAEALIKRIEDAG